MEARHHTHHRRSRRELVVAGVAGAAGAAAAVIATSGSSPRHTVRRPLTPPIATAAEIDIVVLGSLLEFERHAVHVYSLATAGLIGGTGETARGLLAQEREHTHAVERAIRDLGGTPAPLGTYAEWGAAQAAARGRGRLLAVLRTLEQRSVGIYLDALEQISTEDVRATIAAILATEAEHLAVVTGELGIQQLTSPFVLGTGPSAA